MLRHVFIDSPLGELTLVADRALCGVYFPDHHPSPNALGVLADESDTVLRQAADQIREYLAGERTQFTLEIALPESGFYADVWRALLRIGYGEVTTYKSIAEAVARPRAYRAAGTAVGHNPLSIVVPCHRVVAANGKLSGYAGGVERKRWLLDLEERVARRN